MRELPPDFYSYRFKPLVHPQSHKKIPRVGSSEVSLTKLPVEMPHINAAAALQVSMLLFALPAQYFISLWYGTDSAERIQITERCITLIWKPTSVDMMDQNTLCNHG
ncbi:uncharacterized protein GJ701_001666 isoform 3-T3 [Geothlypis trichas]